MKILKLSNNVFNIQKCLLSDGDFLKQNCGSYCILKVPGAFSDVLVKIGLSEPSQISGGILIDNSVIIYNSSYRTKRQNLLKDADYENFTVLPLPSLAVNVNVRIIFNDVTTQINRKKQCNRLRWLIKEILILYTFSPNCVIYLDNLPECKRLGIYCIDIIDVNEQCNFENVSIYTCSKDTNINIIECIKRKKYEMCYCSKEEIKLGGIHRFYEILRETIEFSKNASENNYNFKLMNKILLGGPAGCGKTSLIHSVVKDTKTVLLEVLLPEICSSLPGETELNLQNIFNEAKFHAENQENCVVLIEDIDVLCRKRGANAPTNLNRCVNKLVSLLQDIDNLPGIIIVGTATNLEDVDPQLRSKCFDDDLLITPPTEDDRVEIIRNILNYFKVECSENTISKFALWTPGFVGADLYLAIQECIVLSHKIKNDTNHVEDHLLESSFMKILANITPTSLKESVGLLPSKNVDFSKIGGLHDIKKLLDFYVKEQLLKPEIFMRMGIPLTKGILLYGPPGCAKTTLVKALAKESNMTFLSASSADLYSPYVGDPEKKIVQLFSQARIGAPSIIFIDEIDGLVGSKSGDRMRGVQERVLSTLLVEMDGVSLRTVSQKDSPLQLLFNSCEKKSSNNNAGNEIIVIGATNRPERLDEALKRPGRFDKMVYVPPPDKKERLNILKKLTENMPLDNTVVLESLASATEYYSGADLKNLCYESAIFALTETKMSATSVSFSHFQHVLARTRPSLTYEMIKFYESFQRNIH